jgi:hypothetical protein
MRVILDDYNRASTVKMPLKRAEQTKHGLIHEDDDDKHYSRQ